MDTPAAPEAPRPPVAAVRPHAVASPFGTRTDPYYWLRDDERKDPDVVAYLEAENEYRRRTLAPLAAFEQQLFDEIVGRIKQDDSTVPARKRGWWYYTRFETGCQYPVYARRHGTLESPEQVMIDGNAEAAGHEFYQVGALEVSHDDARLAWAEDTVGRRQYTIRFKDLATGLVHPDRIENAESAIAWANDGRTLFYVEKHAQTLLGFRVRRHVLGTPVADDAIVYEEADESFYLGVAKSKSERFVFITLHSTVSSEYRYAAADDPALEFRIALPRERDHEYDLDDLGERFVIRTNWQAKNFRIVAAPLATVGDRTTWCDVVPHRADAFVSGFDIFRDWLTVAERSGGLRKLRVKRWDGSREFLLDAPEPAYTMYPGSNPEIDTGVYRYVYTSLTTPNTTYDLDLATGVRTLLKRDPVLGDFDPAHYATELLWAPARDVARIPVSLLYRKGVQRDGTAPLYQYAYGAYGLSQDPAFKSSVLTLVDRGFVYAIAHVRGGQDLGREWYERGKLLDKRHTFEDFTDVTEFLLREQVADPSRVFGMGGSAGGLLIGAVANLAPHLYRGLVAHVPFVDVVTTMLDESIPLTTNEYDEWGNPGADRAAYAGMLAYSPYDNVKAQPYPAMLVTTGLWDSQVQYWEPAKWVAKLRTLKTDANPLLLRVNMEAGHGGKSGRFERYREIAEEYAFVLDLAGLREQDAGPR